MPNYNFQKDVILGEEGENVIIKDLQSLGATYLGNNKTFSHDVIMKYNNKSVSYECKTDFYEDTGNLFVETNCRGKKSGILVTQADWFVTYFTKTNEIWYIKTSKLKELIKNHNHTFISKVGDENSNTEGFLINKYAYINHFIVRDSIKNTRIIKNWQKH